MKLLCVTGLLLGMTVAVVGCSNNAEDAATAPTTNTAAPQALPSEMPKEAQAEVQAAKKTADEQGNAYSKAMAEQYKNGPPK
ncbi:MAG: hypothetical protein H7145_11625 [Akkermansiaceae bacterium]|nr:hypothetical protein [Armatimonadota bacterium]